MASRSRRLSVLDLLILVAASTPGLALARNLPGFLAYGESSSMYQSLEYNKSRGGNSSGHVLDRKGTRFTTAGRPIAERPSFWLGHVPYWSGPCLVSWSIVATAFCLRGPRSGLRRAFRAPGPVAGLAVALAMGLQAGQNLQRSTVFGMFLANLWEGAAANSTFYWIALPRLAGFSVVVAWLALLRGGRWRAKPDSVERLGRAVGWAWIAMGLSSEVGVWCFALNW